MLSAENGEVMYEIRILIALEDMKRSNQDLRLPSIAQFLENKLMNT